MVYQLNIGEDEKQRARDKCNELIHEDYTENYEFYAYLYNNSDLDLGIEPCPCTIWQAWRDWGRFRTMFPDYYCYYQVSPVYLGKYTLTQQCCYKFYTAPG